MTCFLSVHSTHPALCPVILVSSSTVMFCSEYLCHIKTHIVTDVMTVIYSYQIMCNDAIESLLMNPG